MAIEGQNEPPEMTNDDTQKQNGAGPKEELDPVKKAKKVSLWEVMHTFILLAREIVSPSINLQCYSDYSICPPLCLLMHE